MQVSNPRISVVTPSYEQGEFIEDCLKSVADQEYGNLEHIVVDNCSTDSTLAVLAAHSDWPHLRVLSEPDEGQSDALNKGIEMATGEWILWLNADDFLLPGAIQRFIETLNESTSANLIYGHVRFVDEHGNLIKVVYHVPYHYFYSRFGAYTPPSTGAFFAVHLLRSNPLDVDFHFTMDSEWFLRCGKSIRSALVDAPMSAFRLSSRNKTAENVRSGTVSAVHAAERIKYREMHVYAKWTWIPQFARGAVYACFQRLAKALLLLRKARYSARYLRHRFG